MTLSIQQISDYGTTNPIVARLSVQTKDLLDLCKLSKQQKEEIFGVMFSDVQPKVMTCFGIKEQLTSEILAQQKKIDENGLEFQEQGRAYTLPSILDLQPRVETFLYSAKSALRDLTTIFRVLFSKDFGREARFDKVFKWAVEQFGDKDPLSEMLRADQSTWIKKIVTMRNAVEHSGGFSGVLHIENFTGRVEGKVVFVIEPVWYLNSEVKTPIAQDMDVMVTNIFTFCEETLILSLAKFRFEPFGFAEIPEAERDPACPIRFRAVLNNSR